MNRVELGHAVAERVDELSSGSPWGSLAVVTYHGRPGGSHRTGFWRPHACSERFKEIAMRYVTHVVCRTDDQFHYTLFGSIGRRHQRLGTTGVRD